MSDPTGVRAAFNRAFTKNQRETFNKFLGHELPILPPDLVTNDAAQAERWTLFESFQRWMLNGFTMFELKMTGCWDKVNARATDLRGYHLIHPIYELQHWAVTDGPPIGNGQPGIYSCHNPIVQVALEPCLILASLFISRSNLWPWYVFRRLSPIADN